jgi:hypothetical protein
LAEPVAARSRAGSRVSAEPLAVSPALIGATLAPPGRRALALGIDLAVVGLLSQFSAWGLVLALVLLAWQVHQALAADGARPWLARAIAAVLVLAALAVAWATLRPSASDPWHEASEAALEQAEAALEVTPLEAPAAASAPILPAAATQAELQRLVSELERLRREHRPPALAEWLDRAVAEVGLGFGWGIVYFSLLPAFWQGRTVGKALLKLRIAELSGRPLTPLRLLKRYGGYAAGFATGGLGFVQALWDPNRQCLHDKAAHTVVLDERAAARLD